MTADERAALARKGVDAYEGGHHGSSLRDLALTGLTPRDAHEVLVAKGFRPRRYAIPTARSRQGEPRWLGEHGPVRTAEDPAAACELFYLHSDGGAVRLYPTLAPFAAYEEVTKGPFARMSVMPLTKTPTAADEACVVTAAGAAVPRALSRDAGLKTSPLDPVASWKLAAAVLASHVIPLEPGPSPRLPLDRGVGLSLGLTMLTDGDLWKVTDGFRPKEPAHLFPLALERERGAGDVRVYFAGSPLVAENAAAFDAPPALASMTLMAGSFVAAIDPFGYEGSVAQLAAQLVGKLRITSGLTFLENGSGRDVTKVVERFVHEALHYDGPPPGLLADVDPH